MELFRWCGFTVRAVLCTRWALYFTVWGVIFGRGFCGFTARSMSGLLTTLMTCLSAVILSCKETTGVSCRMDTIGLGLVCIVKAMVCDISMAMVCDIFMVLACFCWIWGGAWAFAARSDKSFNSQSLKAPWMQIPALADAEWVGWLNCPYGYGAVTWVRFVIFPAAGFGTWVNWVIFMRLWVCLESLRVRSWGSGVGSWVSWFEIGGS
jgi:hypothetical protein